MSIGPSGFRIERSGAAVAVGPLEGEILGVLWNAGKELSVPEVHKAFAETGRALAYSTIKAVLNNLADKGQLTKAKRGKLTYFTVVATREQFDESVMRSVIGSLKRNFGTPVIAQFMDQLAVDEDAIAEIERLLKQRKSELGQ